MKKILQISIAFAAIFLFSVGAVFAQGSTTGSMSGLVTDGTGPLPGATIIALHVPTGSEYATISNILGNYIIKNMKVGTGYQVTVSYVGFKDAITTDIAINLGQNFDLDFVLSEAATELAAVAIVADPNDRFDENRTGAETNIDEGAINMMPNVSRSITDFTRLTPQAKVTPGGGISIAGTNNRYNAIYIDGAVNNDVFGLADNGMNGGQIGISPISIDAIEQFQVVVAPYDVRQGGFAGGGINAVTRSGTNDWHGSAYFLMRNQSLAGKTPDVVGASEAVKLDDFTANTYGFRIGGPVIKNKLHFFANVEIQRDETPQPFSFSQYTGDASADDIASLVNKLNELGYDPGSFENNVRSLDGEKFLLKLDWNISQKHKLTLRHSYVKGVNLSPSSSSSTRIRFENSGINFASTTNSTALELNSTFANTTNNLIIGYTSVRDDRDPMGNPFPYIDIREGDVEVGSEQFSTANLLDQDIFTLTDNFDIYKGKHTITIGTHNEFYNINNVFIRQNFGSYDYNSIDDFVNDESATQFERSYSLLAGDVTGDDTEAAAKFKAMQLGFYAQDEIKFSENFSATFGLRFDIPMFLDNPAEDTYFNNTTIGLIEAEGWDMKGAKAGQAPKAQILVSPRIGFNWKLNDEGTSQLRGGIGIFTSRVPFVWPGGMYNNNGLTVGGVRVNNDDFDIPFNPDPFNQPTKGDFPGQGGDAIPQGQMDLFVEDFKYPQVARASLAIDQKVGKGWVLTAEGIYTKTLNNVFYENVNIFKSTDNLDGTPDTRPIYNGDDVDPTYSRILLGSNTSDGYTYSITGSAIKKFDFGLDFFLAYTYGRSEAVFEGTSSQNSSQWRGGYSVKGRNFTPQGISDFDLGHRWIGALNYRVEYGGFFATSISVVYTGQSGQVFSYTYNDDLTGEDSRERALIYVPASMGDINLGSFDDDDNFVPADQSEWDALNAYIEQDDYLKDSRGGFAEKNGARAPFLGVIDLKIAQDFYIQGDKMRHTLTIGFDIFNFTNMLNSDWGKRYNIPNGGSTSVEVLGFEGFIDGTNTPVYSFNEDRKTSTDFLSPDDAGIVSSRWQAQLSIRYTF